MFNRKRREQSDFSEELLAHLELEIERLRAEGLSEDDAFHIAHRNLGNLTAAGERFYESHRWMRLERLTKSVSYALRQMKSSPVATATIVVSLALGIGVNTAIFSLSDQALMRALPVEKPQELVMLDWNGGFVGGGYGGDNLFPSPFYWDLRRENNVFVDMFARHPADVHLSFGKAAEPAAAEIVSGSYFPALGVRPALGRLLGDDDDVKPSADSVVVVSFDFWRHRLDSDAGVVGKRILVNNFPMTVVGVAEQGFHGVDVGSVPALWIPIMMKREATPGWDALFDRRTRWLNIFGRLKPGINAQQSQVRLQPWFHAYLSADTRREGWPPVTDAQMREYMSSRLDVLPAAQGRSDVRAHIRQPLLILLAATALVLLLACLNVANLSLAKALARRRVTALKTALGASRWRVLGEQFIESTLLAAAGCLGGILLAPLVSRAIISFLPRENAAIGLSAELDLRVLLFALAVTTVTTLLCGLAPALYAASVEPVTALKEQSSAVAGGFGLRRILVAGQFALALVLLIGAGLFLRTLMNLRAQGPGYSTTNLMVFHLDSLADGYTYESARPLVRRVLATLQELPDVQQAGVSGFEMLIGGGWNNPVTVQTFKRVVTDDIPMNAVTPGFFATLGVPVLRGRDFEERDEKSAIVNEEFVKRYLKGAEPLEARVGIGNGPNTVAAAEIVGVVKNFQDYELRKVKPEVFFPLWGRKVGGGEFFVRSRSSSEAAARSVRDAVSRIDPRLSILSLRTIDDQLDRVLQSERMLATLAAGFAALATLLAMIGLYGVLSFSAARRAKEIGIRLALGAPRWSAGGLIVREALGMAVAGLAVAIPASWVLGRYVESQLFGVRPTDAVTVIGASVLLVVVGVGASFVPARRAALISPLEILRSE